MAEHSPLGQIPISSHFKNISPDTCWEWPFAKSELGYGRVRSNGKTISAHRLAYEQANGAIPAGLIVRHACDNPCCVNPDHLEIGTHGDNVADAIKRGRRTQGSQQSAVTHCPQGHPYSSDNTYTHKGQRHCRECSRRRAREYQRKLREAKQ